MPTTLRRRLLGIDVRETRFAVRGFADCPDDIRHRLEEHAAAFVDGYLAALELTDADRLAGRIADTVSAERTGFAYEGAAMAYALLDLLPFPGRRRLENLLTGPGQPYSLLIHAGVGWALARLRRAGTGALRLDPVVGWLVHDGTGFHDTFFAGAGRVPATPPARLRGYQRRVFDQGAGRALWFARGARPGLIAEAVASTEPARHADLWSGVGLAACYAGGADRSELHELLDRAEGHRPELAQGAAAAATARVRGGNVTEDVEAACQVLCDLTAARAAELTEDALASAGADDGSYERARQRVRAHWRTSTGAP